MNKTIKKAKDIKSNVSVKGYIEQQIQNHLNEIIIYETQLTLTTNILEKFDNETDKERHTLAMEALKTLTIQLEAKEEGLKNWSEYYDSLSENE